MISIDNYTIDENYTYDSIKDNYSEYLEPSRPVIDVKLFNKIDNIIRLTMKYVGLVGNLLMLAVYSQGSLRKLSLSIYIRCLAVFCACSNLYYWFIDYHSFSEADQYQILCGLKVFFNFYLRPQCAWFEVAACLDRFLIILFPFNLGIFVRKPLVRRGTIVFLILLNFGSYFNIFMDNKLERFNQCLLIIYNDQGVVDIVIGAAVPFTLMTMLSIATFVGVIKAHRRVKSIAKEDRSRRTLVRDIRFGITMIVLNILFLLFNLPYRLFSFNIYSLGWLDYETQIIFRDIFYEFYEVYYSIIFFVQLAVNSQVRRELLKLFTNIWSKLMRLFQK